MSQRVADLPQTLQYNVRYTNDDEDGHLVEQREIRGAAVEQRAPVRDANFARAASTPQGANYAEVGYDRRPPSSPDQPAAYYQSWRGPAPQPNQSRPFEPRPQQQRAFLIRAGDRPRFPPAAVAGPQPSPHRGAVRYVEYANRPRLPAPRMPDPRASWGHVRQEFQPVRLRPPPPNHGGAAFDSSTIGRGNPSQQYEPPNGRRMSQSAGRPLPPQQVAAAGEVLRNHSAVDSSPENSPPYKQSIERRSSQFENEQRFAPADRIRRPSVRMPPDGGGGAPINARPYADAAQSQAHFQPRWSDGENRRQYEARMAVPRVPPVHEEELARRREWEESRNRRAVDFARGGERATSSLLRRESFSAAGGDSSAAGNVEFFARRTNRFNDDATVNGAIGGTTTASLHSTTTDKIDKKITPNGDIAKPPSTLPAELKKEKSLLKTPTKKASPKSPQSGSTTDLNDKKKVPMNKIQVGAAPSPNLKEVKSKIGSLENYTHKPGGGRVKIENRKLEWNVQPRIEAKNDNYARPGGDIKIPQLKLQWSAKSKIGSLENATHKPGGGDKKIGTVKLDFKEKAKPKIGSKDNLKHVPGGGSVKKTTQVDAKGNPDKIEDQKIELKVQSKVGSLDNVKHKPGGGDKKIFDDKKYLKQSNIVTSDNSKANSVATSGSQESLYDDKKSSSAHSSISNRFGDSERSISKPSTANTTRPKTIVEKYKADRLSFRRADSEPKYQQVQKFTPNKVDPTKLKNRSTNRITSAESIDSASSHIHREDLIRLEPIELLPSREINFHDESPKDSQLETNPQKMTKSGKKSNDQTEKSINPAVAIENKVDEIMSDAKTKLPQTDKSLHSNDLGPKEENESIRSTVNNPQSTIPSKQPANSTFKGPNVVTEPNLESKNANSMKDEERVQSRDTSKQPANSTLKGPNVVTEHNLESRNANSMKDEERVPNGDTSKQPANSTLKDPNVVTEHNLESKNANSIRDEERVQRKDTFSAVPTDLASVKKEQHGTDSTTASAKNKIKEENKADFSSREQNVASKSNDDRLVGENSSKSSSNTTIKLDKNHNASTDTVVISQAKVEPKTSHDIKSPAEVLKVQNSSNTNPNSTKVNQIGEVKNQADVTKTAGTTGNVSETPSVGAEYRNKKPENVTLDSKMVASGITVSITPGTPPSTKNN